MPSALRAALLGALLIVASSLVIGADTWASAAPKPGERARDRYRTPLAGVCPNPLIVQKDWLMQAEHGGLYELIGGGGRMSPGQYRGPLGATGIELIVLEGGRGIGLGDAETAYSALYMGNSRAGLLPHLAMHDLDNAFIFSRRFPATGVIAALDRSPAVLLWDRARYPQGFRSIADLARFGAAGQGKIYVATTKRSLGRYLIAQGVPKDGFMEGFRGDLSTFVLEGGRWLNQGTLTNEVFQLETGSNWKRPIDFLPVWKLGYDVYPGMLAVANRRLAELAPCLQRLVPLLQRAQIDYINDPTEVHALMLRFISARMAAPWWRATPELLEYSVRAQLEHGIVGNGSNATLGDFDLQRVARLLAAIRDTLDVRAAPGVAAGDVVTNRFIDPTIGLRRAAP